MLGKPTTLDRQRHSDNHSLQGGYFTNAMKTAPAE